MTKAKLPQKLNPAAGRGVDVQAAQRATSELNQGVRRNGCLREAESSQAVKNVGMGNTSG